MREVMFDFDDEDMADDGGNQVQQQQEQQCDTAAVEAKEGPTSGTQTQPGAATQDEHVRVAGDGIAALPWLRQSSHCLWSYTVDPRLGPAHAAPIFRPAFLMLSTTKPKHSHPSPMARCPAVQGGLWRCQFCSLELAGSEVQWQWRGSASVQQAGYEGVWGIGDGTPNRAGSWAAQGVQLEAAAATVLAAGEQGARGVTGFGISSSQAGKQRGAASYLACISRVQEGPHGIAVAALRALV